MSRTIFCYLPFILSFAVPAYRPNQAAPAPTTTEINPDCSNVGAGSSMNHIVHLYNNIMYTDKNALGNILHASIMFDNHIHFCHGLSGSLSFYISIILAFSSPISETIDINLLRSISTSFRDMSPLNCSWLLAISFFLCFSDIQS